MRTWAIFLLISSWIAGVLIFGHLQHAAKTGRTKGIGKLMVLGVVAIVSFIGSALLVAYHWL